MIWKRLLALLLIGFMGVGLSAVARPDESAAGPLAYDGDDDDAAVVDTDTASSYVPHDEPAVLARAIFAVPASRVDKVYSGLAPLSISFRLTLDLTRAPPVR